MARFSTPAELEFEYRMLRNDFTGGQFKRQHLTYSRMQELLGHDVDIGFDLGDRPKRKFSLLLQPPEPELCIKHPGYDEDLVISTDSQTLTPGAPRPIAFGGSGARRRLAGRRFAISGARHANVRRPLQPLRSNTPGGRAKLPNRFVRAIAERRPDAVVTSLFGVGVVQRTEPRCPWAVINSTFYLGPNAPRPIEEDVGVRTIPRHRCWSRWSADDLAERRKTVGAGEDRRRTARL